MDVREKLVELLNGVQHYGTICTISQMDDRYASITQVSNTEVAEGLIAHGVTVQEWIPVNEPPKEKGIYQVFLRDKEMERSKVWYGQFTGDDWSVYDIYGDGMRCEVTHWMSRPQPPKGE